MNIQDIFNNTTRRLYGSSERLFASGQEAMERGKIKAVASSSDVNSKAKSSKAHMAIISLPLMTENGKVNLRKPLLNVVKADQTYQAPNMGSFLDTPHTEDQL